MLEYKRPLYNFNQRIEFVYFIMSGVGSLVHTMTNGQAAEVGTIGNEGFVGLPILLGNERGPTSVYVQVPGSGLRMKAEIFREGTGTERPTAGDNAPLSQPLQSASLNRPPVLIFIRWSNAAADGY